MNNIKQLLKEELSLLNKKSLLSEQSILLIEDKEYVEYVLGIKTPINEIYSLSIRKQIIEEQLLVETLLDSINKYLGMAYDKSKAKAIEVIDSIKSLKDIAKFFKDILLDPLLMKVAINSLKDSLGKIMTIVKNSVDKIISTLKINSETFNEKFSGLVKHIENVGKTLMNGSGWKDFIMMLGFTVLLTYVEKTFLTTILMKGSGFIAKNYISKDENIIMSIANLLNDFKGLKDLVITTLDITPILNWFSKISIGSISGGAFATIDVIILISAVLTPIIKAVDWSVKLRKPAKTVQQTI